MKKHFSRIVSVGIILMALTVQCLFLTPVNASASAEPSSWSAVDGLGRTLSTSVSADGKSEKERFVGMFYWTWHSDFAAHTGAINVQKIIEEHPEAKNDYYNEAWGAAPTSDNMGYHFWNEPIYGYYNGTDKFVIRKQAELLADAGVDVIIFDCTNGSFTWKTGYNAVLRAFEAARADGIDTPQIAFMLNFGALTETKTMLYELYEDIYSKEKYKDLWFYWEGKPLVMGYQNALGYTGVDKEIRNFFTFRANDGSYFEDDHYGDGHWGWLSTYPQAIYYNGDNTPEQITVGVAQNADYKRNCITAMSGNNVMGRSYTKGDYSYSYSYAGKKITASSSMENSKLYGLNFQQQWDYAISVDPEFIFVTGWNEWVALRTKTWAGDTTIENTMVDQFTDEYSRDIEPSTGDLKDHYYYQLVENIRRYKGVSESDSKAAEKTIDISGSISQWDSIGAYEHYTNLQYSTRRSTGYGKIKYVNNTFRNDITKAKIAYDDNNIYFYVETYDDLTPETDSAWMRLLIDTDASGLSSNWEGFEYIINRNNPSNGKAALEKSTGGWDWETVGNVDYVKSGKTLQISVPRKLLGLESGTPPLFGFKWSDNMQTDGDIMDFYNNGDVAPGGRFVFTTGDISSSDSEIKSDFTPQADASAAPDNPEKTGCGSILRGSAAVIIVIITAILVLSAEKSRKAEKK